MAALVERLHLWFLLHPKRAGRLVLLLGLFLAGALSHFQWPPPQPREWKEYSVLALEKISSSHNGRIDLSFRLRTSDEAKIGVASDISSLFDQSLLLRQSLPTQVEVYADHQAKGGIIWAEGLRLKSGPTLLDFVAVKTVQVPDQTLAWLAGGLFIVFGLALQFIRPKM